MVDWQRRPQGAELILVRMVFVTVQQNYIRDTTTLYIPKH